MQCLQCTRFVVLFAIMDESAFKLNGNFKNKRSKKIENKKRISGDPYETSKTNKKISTKKPSTDGGMYHSFL